MILLLRGQVLSVADRRCSGLEVQRKEVGGEEKAEQQRACEVRGDHPDDCQGRFLTATWPRARDINRMDATGSEATSTANSGKENKPDPLGGPLPVPATGPYLVLVIQVFLWRGRICHAGGWARGKVRHRGTICEKISRRGSQNPTSDCTPCTNRYIYDKECTVERIRGWKSGRLWSFPQLNIPPTICNFQRPPGSVKGFRWEKSTQKVASTS